MFLESSIYSGHHLFHEPLLNINRFQEAGESGAENLVHGVHVVYPHKRRIYPLGFEIAEQCCSEGPHTLTIPARLAVQ